MWFFLASPDDNETLGAEAPQLSIEYIYEHFSKTLKHLDA